MGSTTPFLHLQGMDEKSNSSSPHDTRRGLRLDPSGHRGFADLWRDRARSWGRRERIHVDDISRSRLTFNATGMIENTSYAFPSV